MCDKNSCDKCLEPLRIIDEVPAMGRNIEAVCDFCSDSLQYCDYCQRFGDEECFSYDQERCDSCCDHSADKFQDRER
ncbi:hypothetical protein M0R04_11415 [Candidatus Dojkabacteria bacterium]|jgi:hypothetical protein|nr:hypothetical protein [Candidatus Dojkabacteria bacterium]